MRMLTEWVRQERKGEKPSREQRGHLRCSPVWLGQSVPAGQLWNESHSSILVPTLQAPVEGGREKVSAEQSVPGTSCFLPQCAKWLQGTGEVRRRGTGAGCWKEGHIAPRLGWGWGLDKGDPLW